MFDRMFDYPIVLENVPLLRSVTHMQQIYSEGLANLSARFAGRVLILVSNRKLTYKAKGNS